MLADHGGHALQERADADVAQRHVRVVERELVHVRGEPLLVHRVLARPVEQHLEHRLVVVAREAGEEIHDLVAPRRREPSGHAEVDHRDAVAGQIEHVARMRVGVEEAVHQDHLQHRVGAALREEPGVEPGALDRREVVPRDALDALLHVHRGARPLREHARDEDVRIVLEVAREALDVARLRGEVELAQERAPEFLDHADRLIASRLGQLALDELREVPEDAQVGLDLRLDARPPHLEHHRCPVDEGRAVHLRDRRRAEGRAVEVEEHIGRRGADRLLDDRQQLVERDRRRAAVQLRELRGPLGRQEVVAGREHLPELDEGRAELLERLAQTLLRLELRAACRRAPLQDLPGPFQHRGDADPADEVAETVPDEDQADLVQARQIAHRTERRCGHARAYFGFLDSGCWRRASAKPARRPLVSIDMRTP